VAGFGLYTTEIQSQTSPYLVPLCYLQYVKSITRAVKNCLFNWQFLSDNSIEFFQTFTDCTNSFALPAVCFNVGGFGLYTTKILSQTSPYFCASILKPIYTAKLNSQFLSGYFIRFFYTFIYCSKLFSLSTDC
jgi:hypothetical protein